MFFYKKKTNRIRLESVRDQLKCCFLNKKTNRIRLKSVRDQLKCFFIKRKPIELD